MHFSSPLYRRQQVFDRVGVVLQQRTLSRQDDVRITVSHHQASHAKHAPGPIHDFMSGAFFSHQFRATAAQMIAVRIDPI